MGPGAVMGSTSAIDGSCHYDTSPLLRELASGFDRA